MRLLIGPQTEKIEFRSGPRKKCGSEPETLNPNRIPPNLKNGTYVSSVMSFEYANVPYVSSGSNNLVEETGEFFRLKFFYEKRFRGNLWYLINNPTLQILCASGLVWHDIPRMLLLNRPFFILGFLFHQCESGHLLQSTPDTSPKCLQNVTKMSPKIVVTSNQAVFKENTIRQNYY